MALELLRTPYIRTSVRASSVHSGEQAPFAPKAVMPVPSSSARGSSRLGTILWRAEVRCQAAHVHVALADATSDPASGATASSASAAASRACVSKGPVGEYEGLPMFKVPAHLRGTREGDRRGSNPRPSEPQSDALPTELRPPSAGRFYQRKDAWQSMLVATPLRDDPVLLQPVDYRLRGNDGGRGPILHVEPIDPP
jgi:hypothetical protein